MRLDRWTLLGVLLSAVGAAGASGPAAAWRVDGRRVNQHLEELSRFGRNPQGGVTRLAFGDADIAARGYAMQLMREAGLEVRVDAAGNLLGSRAGTLAGAAPIVFGSHIDSVPEGGNYDGDVGSMGAVEVARTLAEQGYHNRHPLLVAIWCDEESGLTGSAGFAGQLTHERLAAPGRDGVALADKIRRIDGDPERIAEAAHAPGSVYAYLELHIEQGGTLDETKVPIGVVLGIVGIQHYDLTFTGFANHAGTTPMDRRRNALLAASELVLAVDRVVRSVPGRQVGTVGRLAVRPGAPNVIPGEVRLTVELRDLEMGKIEALWLRIHEEAGTIARRFGVELAVTQEPPNVAAPTDPRMRRVFADAADLLGLRHEDLPSGAGHDAQELARIAPIGMIFVPSVGGISHSPKELTSPEAVENGVNVLLQALLRLDREGLPPD
jgi:N-carbamoyl-L-amino-acid hydrolase